MTTHRKKANSIQALNNICNVHFTVTGAKEFTQPFLLYRVNNVVLMLTCIFLA